MPMQRYKPEQIVTVLSWNKLFGLQTVTGLHTFASSGSLRAPILYQAVPTASFPPFPRPENQSPGHPEPTFSDNSPYLGDSGIVFLGAAA